MKKLKKFSKAFLITTCIVFAVLVFSCAIYYHATTYSVALDSNKLNFSNSNLKIFDKNLKQITTKNNAYIKFNELSSNTTNAFVCAEDKRFYTHNGIDYIRIGGAIISNLKSKSFSEGASTISQQLIKNTLLSNEKTINRKLKEFKLARTLEKKYSKEEILEMYLNNIYFGNGAYGIENASNYYFGKSAKNLSLAESALLAGTINAPSVYDIEKNTNKAIERRNLILNLMHNQNKISKESLENALNEPVSLNITKSPNNNYVVNEILEEACLILNLTENELISQNIEIYTDYDLNFANSLSQTIKNNYPSISSFNVACMIIDNKSNSIIGCYGTSKTLTTKKQPGSTIKPILVYAPAIEKNIVSPATKILDEKINISGYTPSNADGKFHGYVSVREALKNSYNIPAVKLLNEIGIENAQNFANKSNINFSQNDNNLAIALGGFTDGITLKQISDAYSCFANNGNFSESKFITKIKKNNKTIYTKTNSKTKAMSDSTAYLITNMLIDSSKNGTARNLKNLNFEVASKTGTVGKQNSKNNTDAFCVSYTTNHTIITYIGSDSLPSNINGSTYPTLINKNILTKIYKNKPPKNFNQPTSVSIQKIDKSEYSNNIIYKTSNQTDFIEETFSINNLPKENDSNPSFELKIINKEGRKPILSFYVSKNYIYNIIRINKNKEEKISSLSTINNSKNIKFEDISAKNGQIYEYFIEICEKSSSKKHFSNKIKLKSF